MTELSKADVEATVDIAADADAVYRNSDRPADDGGSGSGDDAMQWVSGDTATRCEIQGHQQPRTKTWSTTCTVTDAEPGRVFAFDVRSAVVPVAHWRYDIVATDGGCRVTERTWDAARWFRRLGDRCETARPPSRHIARH